MSAEEFRVDRVEGHSTHLALRNIVIYSAALGSDVATRAKALLGVTGGVRLVTHSARPSLRVIVNQGDALLVHVIHPLPRDTLVRPEGGG